MLFTHRDTDAPPRFCALLIELDLAEESAGSRLFWSNARKARFEVRYLQTKMVLPMGWKGVQAKERDGQRRFLLSCVQAGSSSSIHIIRKVEVR